MWPTHLCVPSQQITIVTERLTELLQNYRHSLLVKINKDIPANDKIEVMNAPGFGRKCILEKIPLAEMDQGANPRVEFPLLMVRAEVTGLDVLRHAAQ